MNHYQKYKAYYKKYYDNDPEHYLIYQRDYDAKILELKNAPKFRKYIEELMKDYQYIQENNLTWEELELIKEKKLRSKYNRKYYQKKKKEEDDESFKII